MGQPNTLTSAADLIERNYDAKVTEEVYSREYICLAKTRKVSKAGNPHHLPLVTSDGAGVSMDLAIAEANAKGVSSAAFSVQMADLFGSVPLESKARKAFKGNYKLIADLVKTEIDAKMNAMGRAQNALLIGAGGGALGRVTALATNTFTVGDDIFNFWEGQQLVFSTGDGTSAGHSLRTGSPGYLTIQTVDRNNKTFTTDAVAGVTGVAVNDYVFLRGTFAGNVTQTGLFKGFGAWFPLAAPTDTLWGIARTGRSDVCGFITPSADAVGGPLQRIGRALVHGFTLHGARPRDVMLHPRQKHQIVVGMQNQGMREIAVSETTGCAGYSKLVYTAEYGEVDIWADPQANAQVAYMLDFNTFEIRHLGEKMIEFDRAEDGSGSIWIPSTTIAGHNIRLTCFSNLTCQNPYKNGTVPLAAVT